MEGEWKDPKPTLFKGLQVPRDWRYWVYIAVRLIIGMALHSLVLSVRLLCLYVRPTGSPTCDEMYVQSSPVPL